MIGPHDFECCVKIAVAITNSLQHGLFQRAILLTTKMKTTVYKNRIMAANFVVTTAISANTTI